MVSPVRALASTLFETGPRDSLATVDAYKGNPNVTPPQTAAAAESASASAIASVFKKVASSESKIASSLLNGNNVTDPASALQRLQQATGGLSSAVGPNSSALTAGQLKAIGAPGAAGPGKALLTPAKIIGDVRIVYSTYQTVIKAKDLNTATGVCNILSQISRTAQSSGIASVLDVQSQFAVLSNVLAQAQKFGIPHAIDVIMGSIAAIKDQKTFILANLRSIIQASNTDAISLALSLVGPAGVLSRVPDATALLLASYRLPPGTSDQSGHDTLVGILNAINSNWAQYERDVSIGNEEIADLSPFTGASTDAIRVLSLDPAYYMQITMRSGFTLLNMLSQAESMYPKGKFA